MSPAWTAGLAIAAIVISFGSLAVSIIVAARDRARIAVSSHFYRASEYGEAGVTIRIANKGRRELFVPVWCAKTDAGWHSHEPLGDDKKGLHLGERKSFELHLGTNDVFRDDIDDGSNLADVWFEDGVGKRYRPRWIKCHIAKLRAVMPR
jgi:hypothetical protein